MAAADAPRQKLSRILVPLVDDLLSMSDEELFAEVREEGGDPAAEAEEVAKLLAASLVAAGKLRMEEARAQLGRVHALRNRPSITGLSVDAKAKILRHFAANDTPLQQRLTTAARNGEGLTESEMDTVLLDLIELGAIDSEGNAR